MKTQSKSSIPRKLCKARKAREPSGIQRRPTSGWAPMMTQGTLTCYFSALEQAVVGHISSADGVVGCVAWMTNPVILAALCGKPVSIVVQSEKFLRRGLKVTNQSVRQAYADLVGLEGRHPVCCAGSPPSSVSRSLMHHKFLVFLRGVEPYAVWTGSYNFSKNSNQSLENAVFIDDCTVAQHYFQEWLSVYATASAIV